MTTLAQMRLESSDEPELREARYRRLRATTVLASASATVTKLQDGKLEKALRQLHKQNFDMERIQPSLLEYVYGVFDAKLTEKITSEFSFVPKWTNVQNHGDRVAYCALCGKGDSLEHRENRDKLRYTFRLQNNAGGQDVWVGSTCIMHHGLHVDGARTAEEAERLLKKAFAAAKLQWQIEEWRATHPDHFEIPSEWERFRSLRFYTYHSAYYAKFGIDRKAVLDTWYRLMGKKRDGSRSHFAAAFKQYNKRGALTPGKEESWIEARRLLGILELLAPSFSKAKQLEATSSYSRYYEPSAKSLDFLDGEVKRIKSTSRWQQLVAAPESVKRRQRVPRRLKK